MFIPGGCFCCDPPEDPCTLSGCTWTSTDMSNVNGTSGLGGLSTATYYDNDVSGSTPDGAYSISNAQNLDVGNESPSRKISITTTEAPGKPDTVYAGCFSPTMRHNPSSQCALPDVSFCVEAKRGSGSDSGNSDSVVFWVRQNNKVYVTQPQSIGENWQHVSGTYVATDFQYINGSSSPDFTSSGTMIEFGFALKLEVGNGDEPVSEVYFDNLCVKIISCQGCLSGCYSLSQDGFSPSIDSTQVVPPANSSGASAQTTTVQSDYYGTSIKTTGTFSADITGTTLYALVKTGISMTIPVDCKLPIVSICMDAMTTVGNLSRVYPAVIQNGEFYAGGGLFSTLNRWQSVTASTFQKVTFATNGSLVLVNENPDFTQAFEVGVMLTFGNSPSPYTLESVCLIDNVCVRQNVPADCTFVSGGIATGDCTVVDGSVTLVESAEFGTATVALSQSSTVGNPAPSALVKFCTVATPSTVNYGMGVIEFGCTIASECMYKASVTGSAHFAACGVGGDSAGNLAAVTWMISQGGSYWRISASGIKRGGWYVSSFSFGIGCLSTWQELNTSTWTFSNTGNEPDFTQDIKIAALVSNKGMAYNFCDLYIDNFAVSTVRGCCGQEDSCDPVSYSLSFTGVALDGLLTGKCGDNFITPLREALEDALNATYVIEMSPGGVYPWGFTIPTLSGCRGYYLSPTTSVPYTVNGNATSGTIAVEIQLAIVDCEQSDSPQHLPGLGSIICLFSVRMSSFTGDSNDRCTCNSGGTQRLNMGPQDFYFHLDPGCSSPEDSCCATTASLEWYDNGTPVAEDCTSRFYIHPNLFWNWDAVTLDIQKL